MSVQVKGSGTIGGLDEGLVVSGIVTSSTQINVGSNIKLGNAGVVTATTFSGNLSGGTVSGTTGTFTGDLSIAQNLVHTGDTDTKLEFHTDSIKLFTAGTQKFRIYDDGVVSIGQSSKSSTVGAGNLDIQGNATSCIIEMGNPFPTFSGGVVPEFRITATNSSHTVDFESVWGGDNLLHKHLSFSGGTTRFYKGTTSDEVARFNQNNFGVGTQSPGQLIHTHSGSSSGGLMIQSNGSTNYVAAIQTANNFANGSTAGGLVIRSGNGIEFSGNDGSTVQMRLASSGDLTVGDGNLVVGTAGHGIDFSATSNSSGTMTSELLDNYEEGTWTPTIYRSNNSGVSGSYNHQEGSYVRVGRLVFALFRVDITSFSGGSGHVVMGGLPYSTHSHGVGGWTNVANMRRMYLDGDFARGDNARSLVGASGISYLYVMNLDTDQWDYGNYGRILFDGCITYQTS